MLIKICGMRDACNIAETGNLIPDMMGFIFYPGSPRYAGTLKPEVVAALPGQIERVGVFVNEKPEVILEVVVWYGITTLQLHGDESPSDCDFFRKKGFRVIKAFGIADKMDFSKTRSYEGKCDFFLFDTRTGNYGGSGRSFNWQMLGEYRGVTPFLLSGGISAEHLSAIRQIQHPFFAGVDLNSQFECLPGYKDVPRLTLFLKALRRIIS